MATDGFPGHRRFATLAAIVTMPFRILSLLLCLLIAGPMSTPAWALARPEARVGKFFSSPLKSTSADLDQTLEPRWESGCYGYDVASGVCKYLYAHADPVNRIDPSGHFSITEVVSVQGIQKTLNTIKNTRVARFWTRGLRNKTTDISLVTTRTVPGLPSHWYIYVDRRGSGVDLAYHVGVENVRGFLRRGLSRYVNIFPGEFSIVPTTYAEVRLEAFKIIKVASLNDKQFAAWNALVIPLGMVGDTAEVPYSVPGYPLTFNCYKWTAEAAAAALFLQFFPF